MMRLSKGKETLAVEKLVLNYSFSPFNLVSRFSLLNLFHSLMSLECAKRWRWMRKSTELGKICPWVEFHLSLCRSKINCWLWSFVWMRNMSFDLLKHDLFALETLLMTNNQYWIFDELDTCDSVFYEWNSCIFDFFSSSKQFQISTEA